MTMEESHRKVVHYLIIASLVVLTFGVQTLGWRCYQRIFGDRNPTASSIVPIKAWRSLDYRMVTSALVAFIVGVLKQVGDALSLQWLPWCSAYVNGCEFNWLDLFLTVDGILTGLLVIIASHVLMNQCYRPRRRAGARDLPCDPTVAMTIDQGDGSPNAKFDDDSLPEFEDDDFEACRPDGQDDCCSESPATTNLDRNSMLEGHEDDAPSLHSQSTGPNPPKLASDCSSRHDAFTTISSSPSLNARNERTTYPMEIITI